MLLRRSRRACKAIVNFFMDYRRRFQVRGETKYFVIGRNKTGTTSVKKAFIDLGFLVGDQRRAENLADKYYFSGNFAPIISYCRTAEVFQDVPFSYPETFRHMDKAYPGSKFILTVRDDSEQWYRSITRFHAKKFGKNGQVPSANDLKSADYVRAGYMYNVVKVHGTSDASPYDHTTLIAHYERHNREIIEYFSDRPDDLLVINLSEDGAYKNFLDFIGKKDDKCFFPFENKT